METHYDSFQEIISKNIKNNYDKIIGIAAIATITGTGIMYIYNMCKKVAPEISNCLEKILR